MSLRRTLATGWYAHSTLECFNWLISDPSVYCQSFEYAQAWTSLFFVHQIGIYWKNFFLFTAQVSAMSAAIRIRLQTLTPLPLSKYWMCIRETDSDTCTISQLSKVIHSQLHLHQNQMAAASIELSIDGFKLLGDSLTFCVLRDNDLVRYVWCCWQYGLDHKILMHLFLYAR